MNKRQYISQHYAKLQGHTMVGLIVDDSPEVWQMYGEPMVGMKFKNMKTGHVLIVFPMSDEEGNDIGHLDIVEME